MSLDCTLLLSLAPQVVSLPDYDRTAFKLCVGYAGAALACAYLRLSKFAMMYGSGGLRERADLRERWVCVCATCRLRGREGGGGGTSSSHPSPPPVSQVPSAENILGKSLATGPTSTALFVTAAALPSVVFCMLALVRACGFLAMIWSLCAYFWVPDLHSGCGRCVRDQARPHMTFILGLRQENGFRFPLARVSDTCL